MRFSLSTVAALVAVAILSLCATPAFAQVKNPSAVEFQSKDHGHAEVTGYEFDIKSRATGAVIQTLAIAKAAVELVPNTTPQVYRVSLNVQPIAFGVYVSAMRTVAGGVKSGDSADSAPWERSPTAPDAVAAK